MKKIILSIFAVLALVSCIKEDLPQPVQVQEGDEVTITFDVQVPDAGAATRVMGDEAITTLHLLVFDERGYFIRAEEATLAENPTYPLDSDKCSFTVTLSASSNKRIIHFVANIDPTQYEAIEAGHEDYIMSNLYVTGDADAYWQRMEFSGGISATSGANVFDGSDVVPLIRNYAKIQVKDATGDKDAFTLIGYKVFNTRDRGSVAAYNGEFVNFTEMNPETDANGKKFTPYTYDVMHTSYSGFELGDLVDVGDYSDPKATYYVRETSKESKPYIIIKGTYNGAECYYKLDFIVGGEDAHILRNFAYTFVINNVEKAGTTEELAKSQERGENGLSFDSGTSSLLNISDGVGQLFVSATQVVLTNTNEYYLMYKYIPDITKPTTNVNVGVTHNAAAGDVFESFVREGTIGDANDKSGTGTEYAGYKYLVLQPKYPEQGSMPDQEITITNGAGLTRVVKFYLQFPYEMTVTAYDGVDKNNEVARGTGQKVWVDVAIPSNLKEYIFPLDFVFEAEQLSIYPDAEANNLPVRSGQSIINSSKSAFGFVYTLTWDEYSKLTTNADGNKVFTAKFLTNKAANASQVYVANHYFNTGFDGFENPEIKYVTSLSFSAIGSNLNGENRTVTITSGSAEDKIITLNSDEKTATSCEYDLTGLGLTNDSVVTITGEYTVWKTADFIPIPYPENYSCNYTTTIGELQGKTITLPFTSN